MLDTSCGPPLVCWQNRWFKLARENAANILTNPALDPFGKIPEFKYCAARVQPIDSEARIAAE